ncbi:unnamed protein product, partial [marine sediment metagenome]
KPCVIIGGGPCLKNFNWELLTGWRTIGVNRAYEQFTPTVSFSMDTRFLMWVRSGRYGKGSADRFANLKSYKVWLITYPASLPKDIFIVPAKGGYTEGHYALSKKMTKGLGHGNNSGYGALNLAICLGANPVYLLGYSMKHAVWVDKDGKAWTKTHWHEGHPMPQYKDTVEKFIHYYDHAAPKIKDWGIDVINLSKIKDTNLRCFPIKDPREILGT